MLKIGIVGLGNISNVHLCAIEKIPGAKLVAACDIDIAKRHKVPGDVKFYTNVEEMLDNEKIDCLHICLPHYLNVPICLLAAKKGVNVFVEKPVGMNQADIKGLRGVADKIRVGVCLQNRYNETTLRLKEIIDHETYGKITGIKAVLTWSRDMGYYKDSWRSDVGTSGGGVIITQAIHTIDLMQYLAGEVDWVKGMSGNLLHEALGVEDTACAHMSFKNGAAGVFYSTVTYVRNSAVEFEVVLENALLRITDGKLVLMGENEEVLAENGAAEGGKDYWGNKHYEAICSFYETLSGNRDDYITIDEAAKAVYVIDAIVESAKGGKRIYL